MLSLPPLILLAAVAFAPFALEGRTPVFSASFHFPATLAAPFASLLRLVLAGERIEGGDELARLVETIALAPARHLLLLE
jgi:hypothetical protein